MKTATKLFSTCTTEMQPEIERSCDTLESVAERALRSDILEHVERFLRGDVCGFKSICRLREAVGERPPQIYVCALASHGRDAPTCKLSFVGERVDVHSSNGFASEQHVYLHSKAGTSTCVVDLFFAAAFRRLELTSSSVAFREMYESETDSNVQNFRCTGFHSSQECVLLVVKGVSITFSPIERARPAWERRDFLERM